MCRPSERERETRWEEPNVGWQMLIVVWSKKTVCRANREREGREVKGCNYKNPSISEGGCKSFFFFFLIVFVLSTFEASASLMTETKMRSRLPGSKDVSDRVCRQWQEALRKMAPSMKGYSEMGTWKLYVHRKARDSCTRLAWEKTSFRRLRIVSNS